jgi:undecaprenyl-diphosphatase
MTLLQSFLLGIIQGVTEFLPISSTAHLILAQKLLHIEQTEFLKTFDVLIQSGSAFAVLVLWGYKLLQKKELFVRVLVAFIPTAIIGLALHDFVKAYLYESANIIIAAMAIGGVVMLLIDRKAPVATQELKTVTYKQAVGIGLSQSLALVPGVSRSAASICGAMLLGLGRSQATEFSFLLAIPTLLAASALDLYKAFPTLSSSNIPLLATGFLAAFVSSILVMLWLLKFIAKHRFTPFAVYRIVAAGLLAMLLL